MFKEGDRVRYRPGLGTSGYDDAPTVDGRVAGVVLAVSRTGRVRCRFDVGDGRTLVRAVFPTSLRFDSGLTENR